MRGKQSLYDIAEIPEGSIPACAGETDRWGKPRRPFLVYPRVCGGNSGGKIAASSCAGLSPRVRGKRPARPRRPRRPGSIPACAGETHSAAQMQHRETVYPRVCGGNARPAAADLVKRGLSPRVRGKPAKGVYPAYPDRSIPACAGETGSSCTSASMTMVYPRVCGGNAISIDNPLPESGLSPRVRGKPMARVTSTVPVGSIPACAGETKSRRRRPSAT